MFYLSEYEKIEIPHQTIREAFTREKGNLYPSFSRFYPERNSSFDRCEEFQKEGQKQNKSIFYKFLYKGGL